MIENSVGHFSLPRTFAEVRFKILVLQAFLWVTWHCHLDSNLREKRKFFIGLEYSSRQGAKNAKFGNLFCFFAAFASLREIIIILVAGAPR
jgi:hypothetical protein